MKLLPLLLYYPRYRIQYLSTVVINSTVTYPANVLLFTVFISEQLRPVVTATSAGTIFRSGEQMKNNPDNQIQNITLCNEFFEKGTTVPEPGKFSRISVLKVTLEFVRLLLTVSYRKNWGSRTY